MNPSVSPSSAFRVFSRMAKGRILGWLSVVACVPLLLACGSTGPVPVVDRDSSASGAKPSVAVSSSADGRPGYYTVKKGDTLYGIALDNGQDYRDIKAWNNIENIDLIKIGQQLRVSPDSGAPVAVARPVTSNAPLEIKTDAATTTGSSIARGASNTELLKHEPRGGKVAYSEAALARARQAEATAKPETKLAEAKTDAKPDVKPDVKPETKLEIKPEPKPAPVVDEVDWMWPSNGKLLTSFAEGSSKGVDLAGKVGDPVLAAGSGVVSYSGSGLRGYGNLVVVRHNSTYLSVYAHNSKILVKEKQAVTKGQKIAEIGSSDADSPRLHFEIRRLGKPADPQKFLPVL